MFMQSSLLKGKIVTGKYDTQIALKLFLNTSAVTRDNKYKLLNKAFQHNLGKFSFTAKIDRTWNILPNAVVDIDNVDLLKSRLDIF